MGVNYYVNPAQFAQHPIYSSIITSNPTLGFTSSHDVGSTAYRQDLVRFIRQPSKLTQSKGETNGPNLVVPKNLKTFERTVEQSYVHHVQALCRREVRSV